MGPTHSQMITLSHDMRANIAGVPALIVSLVVVFGLDFSPRGSEVWATGSAAVSPALAGGLITVFLVASGTQDSPVISAARGSGNSNSTWTPRASSATTSPAPCCHRR